MLLDFPEYFRLAKIDKKDIWVAVDSKDVPNKTQLKDLSYSSTEKSRPEPYIMPIETNEFWRNPGPVAGPFKSLFGDGSTVTYYWYRFADQPALLNSDLSKEERESMQVKIEKMHRKWGETMNI